MDTWDWGRVRGNSRRSSTSFSRLPTLPQQVVHDPERAQFSRKSAIIEGRIDGWDGFAWQCPHMKLAPISYKQKFYVSSHAFLHALPLSLKCTTVVPARKYP